MGYCPDIGGNWLRSSAIHRVWSDSLPCSRFLLLCLSPTLAPPKQFQTIAFPPPCVTDGIKPSIFSVFLHLANVHFPKNLKLQMNRFVCPLHLFFSLPLSSVCVLWPILISYFYWPVSEMSFFLYNSA